MKNTTCGILLSICIFFLIDKSSASIVPDRSSLHHRPLYHVGSIHPRDIQGLNYTGDVSTSALNGTVSSNRIQITLPGDDNSTFTLNDGFQCLSNFYDPGCWEALGMNEWLTKWVSCKNISDRPSCALFCRLQDSS